jgi:hypothetical protein
MTWVCSIHVCVHAIAGGNDGTTYIVMPCMFVTTQCPGGELLSHWLSDHCTTIDILWIVCHAIWVAGMGM